MLMDRVFGFFCYGTALAITAGGAVGSYFLQPGGVEIQTGFLTIVFFFLSQSGILLAPTALRSPDRSVRIYCLLMASAFLLSICVVLFPYLGGFGKDRWNAPILSVLTPALLVYAWAIWRIASSLLPSRRNA